MTGLEKMKSRILEEARSSAEVKIQDANRQARELLDERKRQAEGSAAAILEKARADAEGLKEKALSASDLERRTRLLGARQEMIAEVLEEAYRKIKDMDTAAYFELIERLLDHYVLPQEGEIHFSPADAQRMPDGFEAKIQKAAEAKGGSLTLAEGDPLVPDGFVLVYGGIEENCTFKAIFETRRDEMSDRVQKRLFSRVQGVRRNLDE